MVHGQNVYYYKDKFSWEKNPNTPLNKRPIDLEGYTLEAGTIGTMGAPYTITLTTVDPEDVRKKWRVGTKNSPFTSSSLTIMTLSSKAQQ